MPKITEMFAWVSTEPDGGEGICAAQMVMEGQLIYMPLIGADANRVESLRSTVIEIHRQTGHPIKLVKFSSMEVIESIPSNQN